MAVSDYTPTVGDIAMLIPSRAAARFTGGTGSPAFPDTDRVEAVVADAVGIVAPQLGGDSLDSSFYAGAKALVKLKAALLLEPSAWPEQAQPDKSAYEQWESQYTTDLKGLTEAIIRFRESGQDDPGEAPGAPWFGGGSLSRKAALAAQSDRLQPRFGRGQFDASGA